MNLLEAHSLVKGHHNTYLISIEISIPVCLSSQRIQGKYIKILSIVYLFAERFIISFVSYVILSNLCSLNFHNSLICNERPDVIKQEHIFSET